MLPAFASGVFALVVLETVTRTQANAERAAGLIGWANSAVSRLMDPTVPAIADHRDGIPAGALSTQPAAGAAGGWNVGWLETAAIQSHLATAAANITAANNGRPPTQKDPPR